MREENTRRVGSPLPKEPSLTPDSLTFFKELVETSPALFWQVDGQGNFTYLSPAWEHALGYRPQEMTGKSLADFLFPDDAAGGDQWPGRLSGASGTVTTLVVCKARSGNPVRLLFLATVVRDGRGIFLGARGTALDATGLAGEGERLATVGEKDASFAELSREWFWEMDLEGNHTSSNPLLTAFLGYQPQEFLGKPAVSFLHPDDREKVEAELPRLQREKRGWQNWTLRWRHRDGTWRFLESNAVPILGADGQLRGYRGSDRDVTGQFPAELAARILHESVVGLATCNDLHQGAERALHAVFQFGFVDCGGIYFSLAGDGSLDLIAHHGLSNEFVKMVAHIPAESPRIALVQTGEPWYGSYPRGRIPSEPMPLGEGLRAMAVIPVMHQGQLIGVFNLASHSIDAIPTESRPTLETIAIQLGETLFRLRTEITLRESEKRIDKLDSLGVLAGGIAHDFNNLLSGLLGHLDLARMFSEKNPKALNHIDHALGIFNRARGLTRQLLTFSKGGAPKRKAGQLSPVIRRSVEFALSGSNVRCEDHLSQELWLSDFDEDQIAQAVGNIVLNAQQAMPAGGILTLSAANLLLGEGELPPLRPGKYVKVSISDTGPGIPLDLLPRIFDPFFSNSRTGPGLGLAICHSIMLKHEGFIGVDSVLGKGTTFHLYFPASQQPGDIPKAKAVISATQQGGSRILIMDDEDFIRYLLTNMLTPLGFKSVGAKDGQEALRLIAEAREQGDPFCAAFFDLTIPGGMGGKEAIRELRKSFPDLPVFASSGYSDDPAMAQPQDFGFTDSLQKPYGLSDLSNLLNRHLKRPLD